MQSNPMQIMEYNSKLVLVFLVMNTLALLVCHQPLKNECLSGDTKGLAAVPGKEDEFKQCLELSIDYAEALGCKKYEIRLQNI